MTVEGAGDRLALVADYGIDAIYAPAVGGSAVITGILDGPYLPVNLGNVAIEDARPSFFCRTADIPAGARGGDVGDALTCDAVTYRVAEIQPDGQGMTLIILAK